MDKKIYDIDVDKSDDPNFKLNNIYFFLNDHEDTINAMLSESEIINNLIADIKTGEKGSLYTDSILTIPSQYLTEEIY